MNPWDAIGWLLLVIVFAIALFTVVIVLAIFIALALGYRDQKREKERLAQAPNVIELKEGLGETVIIAGREWRTDLIETEYLPERSRSSARITVSTGVERG